MEQVIENEEQLFALPGGAVVQDATGRIWSVGRDGDGLQALGTDWPFDATYVTFPAVFRGVIDKTDDD